MMDVHGFTQTESLENVSVVSSSRTMQCGENEIKIQYTVYNNAKSSEITDRTPMFRRIS